jgi:hypothetical protein
MKVAVGGTGLPVVLRSDGLPGAAARWSPTGDWITWETDAGVVLVSSDGAREQRLGPRPWLAHTWSHDGTAIFNIAETENLQLALQVYDIRRREERVLRELGPSPPVNNPVRGLSLNAKRKSLITGIVHVRGDVWLMEGLQQERGLLDRLWRTPSSAAH